MMCAFGQVNSDLAFQGFQYIFVTRETFSLFHLLYYIVQSNDFALRAGPPSRRLPPACTTEWGLQLPSGPQSVSRSLCRTGVPSGQLGSTTFLVTSLVVYTHKPRCVAAGPPPYRGVFMAPTVTARLEWRIRRTVPKPVPERT
jgi:hypothetical protein